MKRLLVVCAVFLVLPCVAFAAPVPDTGQTKCYETLYGEEVPCPLPNEPYYGQDAHYIFHPQSYTKLDWNGDDLPDEATEWIMVRDNVTGLIWQKNTEGRHSFQQALTYCENLTLGGYTDWRLPTVKELASIVSNDRFNPAINTECFTNARSSEYWSSTPVIWSEIHGFVVKFADGDSSLYYMTQDAFVRAVRGGQCGSFGNYIDNGDGTVTDTSTNLMWQKETASSYYMWEALLYCKNLILNNDGEWTNDTPNSSGVKYDDWRLPDVNELHSIVDYYRSGHCINPVFSLGPYVTPVYCSSTTVSCTPSDIWVVSFANGAVFHQNRLFREYDVRAVRDGPCESFGDLDGDCRIDCIDNCPSISNCLSSGICTKGTILQSCVTNEECGDGGFCSIQNEDTDSDYLGDVCDECTDTDKDGYGNSGFILNTCLDDNCPNDFNPFQEDSLPPQGNGIGDACDCEGNFNCSEDQDVDGSDASLFKSGFGRSIMNRPCIASDTCNGDFSCDGDVDGTDASMFKSDFGRSSIINPCPACVVNEWCPYQ